MTHQRDNPKRSRFEPRINSPLSEWVEEWRRRQPKIPSRSEAVRQLVEIGLKSESACEAQ